MHDRLEPIPADKDPQTLEVTLVFKTKHNPGTPLHLLQIAKNYFRGKGVKLEGDVIEI